MAGPRIGRAERRAALHAQRAVEAAFGKPAADTPPPKRPTTRASEIQASAPAAPCPLCGKPQKGRDRENRR